ncbi:MAG: lysophospholipid acyltransferase family protein [Deltaproteobacteria bacterium]|nr:lysophospholipid acyltransferase family protein [Deltaproteobacteria bacterium]
MTVHPLHPQPKPHRQAHGAFARFIGRLWLKAFGFRVAGQRPPVEKYVLICAPHTSNWDAFFMLAMSFVLDMKLSWMVKHTIVKGAFGRFLRSLGAVPIDRTSPQNMVEQMADAFAKSDELVLAVPPEGTRKHTDYWKTGFYYIALKAGVPIVPSVLDYAKRIGTVLPPFTPTGDIDADMQKLAAIYAEAGPKHPALHGPVRVRPQLDDERQAAVG